VREQRVVLEDGVHLALERRSPRDVHTVEFDHAGRRSLEPGDQPQAGRLSRAGRTEEGEELAVGDLEIEVFERDDVPERLAQADQANRWRLRGPCRR
jgi:hypothetical protein